MRNEVQIWVTDLEFTSQNLVQGKIKLLHINNYAILSKAAHVTNQDFCFHLRR